MSNLLSTFTPSMMPREALESLFVQRHALASRLVELIRVSSETKSKHYTLVVGPRGIGKTHLVSLLYHRIRDDKDMPALKVAWLKEDEWGIESFRDLLLRVLVTLATEYKDAALLEGTEALFKRSAIEVESLAGALLRNYIGHGTLLLIAENLDQVFRGLGDLGQKRFRAYVQETGFFTIVATATSLFSGVARRTSPFYGFFRIEQLSELSLGDAVELLRNIARFKNNVELAELLLTPLGRARIRAVHHLAGGNHRIYVIFSQLLTAQSLDELVAPLMKTIDDLTPYYQSRMTDISQQQRRIVEVLAHRGRALTVREIAQRSFATQQTASRQLKTLLELGYVRVTHVGRESYYELREPLMRLCLEVKQNRAEPVRLLVDFLRLWYLPTELRERLALLPPEASWERRCLADALEEVRTQTDDPRVTACLRDLKIHSRDRDWQSAAATAEELTMLRGSTADWDSYAHCLGHSRRWDEALRAVDKALALDSTSIAALHRKIWILSNMHRYSEALPIAETATQLKPEDGAGWDQLGDVYFGLDRFSDALKAYEHASALGEDEAVAGRAHTLAALGHKEEALTAIGEALERKPRDARLFSMRGRILYELDRNEEALEAINKAIELAPNQSEPWTGKGSILCRLGRHAEEVEAFRKAVAVSEGFSTWQNLTMALVEAGATSEAIEASDKALSFEGASPSAWHVRGQALLDLGRTEEALAALEKARSLGDTCATLPVQIAQALVALRRWDASLELIRKTLALGSQKVDRDFRSFISQVLESEPAKDWSSRARDVVTVFSDGGLLPVLGTALVSSIQALKGRPSDASAWSTAWDQHGKGHSELLLARRLLATAARFYEASDRKVLLELPIEERKVIEELIELK